MIKLIFKQPHLSIKQLDTVELSDFSMLTGLNGVGKTHLLHAIRDGKIEIQGIGNQEIIYFNYNDFLINPHTDHRLPEFQKNTQKVQQNKDNLFSFHKKQIKNILQQVSSYRDPLDYALSAIILNSKYSDFETSIGTRNDFNIFKEEVKTIKSKEDLLTIQSLVTTQFVKFLKLYFNRKQEEKLDNLNYEQVEKRYNEINSKLVAELQQINPEYFDFLTSNINPNKSIFNLTATDFENVNLFASEIAEEVKNYAILQCNNDHNEIRATKWEENIAYLSREQFFKKHGRHPFTILNEVLNEYDCNGYRFQESSFYPKPGQDLKMLLFLYNWFTKKRGTQRI